MLLRSISFILAVLRPGADGKESGQRQAPPGFVLTPVSILRITSQVRSTDFCGIYDPIFLKKGRVFVLARLQTICFGFERVLEETGQNLISGRWSGQNARRLRDIIHTKSISAPATGAYAGSGIGVTGMSGGSGLHVDGVSDGVSIFGGHEKFHNVHCPRTTHGVHEDVRSAREPLTFPASEP